VVSQAIPLIKAGRWLRHVRAVVRSIGGKTSCISRVQFDTARLKVPMRTYAIASPIRRRPKHRVTSRQFQHCTWTLRSKSRRWCRRLFTSAWAGRAYRRLMCRGFAASSRNDPGWTSINPVRRISHNYWLISTDDSTDYAFWRNEPNFAGLRSYSLHLPGIIEQTCNQALHEVLLMGSGR
jgi:hypothetical protein